MAFHKPASSFRATGRQRFKMETSKKAGCRKKKKQRDKTRWDSTAALNRAPRWGSLAQRIGTSAFYLNAGAPGLFASSRDINLTPESTAASGKGPLGVWELWWSQTDLFSWLEAWLLFRIWPCEDASCLFVQQAHSPSTGVQVTTAKREQQLVLLH